MLPISFIIDQQFSTSKFYTEKINDYHKSAGKFTRVLVRRQNNNNVNLLNQSLKKTIKQVSYYRKLITKT